jgi:hypothetical protein
MARRSGNRQVPLTDYQRRVLRILAANRSEESHFAGGIILNSADDAPRYSDDFDIFHDAAEAVAAASSADCASLQAAGYTVVTVAGDWERPSGFRRAAIISSEGRLEIDWAADAAVRFFPVQRDPVMGWRLHLFDMATNKALALSSRSVTRDYVDIVELCRRWPLHVIVWAACGKDPGFTPSYLLEMMRRFARINPRQLETIQSRRLDPVTLKVEWTEQSVNAEIEITRLAETLPDTPIGVAFVNAAGEPGWLLDDRSLFIHRPSVRGCWPCVSEGEEETS